jgi:aconitate hydratase
MGQNVFEKVITPHIVTGSATVGAEVAITIDQTLTQDATGTMAYLAFESLGISKTKTELSVSYVDHNTLQQSFENADDHTYLATIAEKYGLFYSKAGNGICHQVHLERFARPGKTLLGSDSHTPTGGGMGMIAIGAGGMDVALAMAGLPFTIIYPKVIQVYLSGKLAPWVSAKDVILEVLRLKTTKGNVNTVIEYNGPGVKTLTLPQRATITNMGAELGVTTSLFPSDDETRLFLKAQGRLKEWVRIEADKDAAYDETISLDLAKLEPLVACPHSPDNVKKVKELKKTAVDQVCIGSCTNSSFQDLMVIAKVLEKMPPHPDVSLVIAPGSKQVFEMIAANGALETFIKAGARIAESACGFCIGMGQSPKDNAVSVRTNNRNFFGRSGTKTAGIYLVSPETAAACAVTGKLTDPRTLKLTYPKISAPQKYVINDNMILFGKRPKPKTEIYRGPNIEKPPVISAPTDTICAPVLLKVGDKITTDHIMPAGQRLKYRSNVPKYAEYVFETVDSTFPKRALQAGASFVVAGKSYGQGSSREHAALCPAYLGVKAIMAESIERIHRANLVNYGILPLTFKSESDYAAINQLDQFEIKGVHAALKKIMETNQPEELCVLNKTRNVTFSVLLDVTSRDAEIILAGGRLNFVKKQLDM